MEFLAFVLELGVWFPAQRGPGFLRGLAEELRFFTTCSEWQYLLLRLLKEKSMPYDDPVAKSQNGGEQAKIGNRIIFFIYIYDFFFF